GRFVDDTRAHLAASAAILERLATRYRLGIISNFYGNLAAICAEAGLSPLLGVVADSTVVGAGKPDARIFRHALDALGVAPAAAAGVPLSEAGIGNFQAAGIDSLVVIVNEASRACETFVRGRFPALDVEFIVKSTRSSLESFLEVGARLGPGPALVSTVDAWCRPADFVRFVEAGRRGLPDGSVLGVTPPVAGEKPL